MKGADSRPRYNPKRSFSFYFRGRGEPLIQELLRQALAGDAEALGRLVERLTPVVQCRVARGLLARRDRSGSGRDVRQEVEDLCQEVFLVLFADDGKVLRTWQPDRGLSLENFVGLVAERRTASLLRSGVRSPWRDDPTLAEDLDGPDEAAGPEEQAVSRDQLRRLWERLTEELSPLARHLFDLVFLRELSPDEVAAETGMSHDAIYAWRSRLRRLAAKRLAEMSDSAAGRRSPRQGQEP